MTSPSDVIRQLFRPRYGRYFDVAPRRWWDPRDRRSARIAAAVADHIWEKERRAACALARQHADGRVPPDQIWIVPDPNGLSGVGLLRK